MPERPWRLSASTLEGAMSRRGERRQLTSQMLSRRGFLGLAIGTTSLFLVTACGGQPAAPPKAAEAPKPAEAAKPAAPAPAATTAPAASTAPGAGAKPAAAV